MFKDLFKLSLCLDSYNESKDTMQNVVMTDNQDMLTCGVQMPGSRMFVVL